MTKIRLLLYAHIGVVISGSKLLVEKGKTFQQMTKADDFCCEWRFKS